MFPTKCPLDYAAKDWVEDSLHLLASEFGPEVLRERPVVEPTEAFFPEPYIGNLAGAKTLLRRTADFMDADLEAIEPRIVPARGAVWLVDDRDHAAAPSAPQADPDVMVFALELDDLSRPDQMVGLFARELAGLRLSEEAGIGTDAYDFGCLADLLAAFCGLGVFTAAVEEIEKLPTERIAPCLPHAWLGYALAHVAWHRGEERPAWAKWLEGAAAANFKQGLRWLLETGESDFRPA